MPRTAGIGALQPVADHAAAHAAHYYGQYLGRHGQFERSLDHVARAIELLGARSELFEQAIAMTLGGRCYSMASRFRGLPSPNSTLLPATLARP